MNIAEFLDTDDLEEIAMWMRCERDRLLAESDWTQTHDDPTGQRDEWAAYRQALRDFPATWVPGPTVEFPELPGVS